MKEYATEFYSSTAWKKCRAAYAKAVGGLCEDCLAKGVYTAGEIVHHIGHITPQNIGDPNVTLSFDNLRLVCRECHAREHGAAEKRYTYDADGNISPL